MHIVHLSSQIPRNNHYLMTSCPYCGSTPSGRTTLFRNCGQQLMLRCLLLTRWTLTLWWHLDSGIFGLNELNNMTLKMKIIFLSCAKNKRRASSAQASSMGRDKERNYLDFRLGFFRRFHDYWHGFFSSPVNTSLINMTDKFFGCSEKKR
jgi:hypothetical protein